jgi:5-formyltetrahydrofolate cyclo-ligase
VRCRALVAALEEAARAKQAVRERVWSLLERERVARVLKANADAPQLPVRARALADGKLLYMAVPRLADGGSVAVNREGVRVGKGGGFSDLEFALLADHDFRLDLIVAGEEVVTCRRTRRPPGILWEHLDAAMVAAVPALAARAPDRADRQG